MFNRRAFLRLLACLLPIIGLLVAGDRARLWSRRVYLRLNPSAPPAIISRHDWQARAPNHKAVNEYGFAKTPLDGGWYHYPQPLEQVYKTVAIHHTATINNTDETMRYVQNLHMDRNQWADVGYHYGIDRQGRIYEGRRIGVRGSSVAGHNTGTIGVALMGNFESAQPTAAQFAALDALLAWLVTTYPLTHLAAHGEFNAETVCPGRHLWDLLNGIALNAGLERGTAGYVAPTV